MVKCLIYAAYLDAVIDILNIIYFRCLLKDFVEKAQQNTLGLKNWRESLNTIGEMLNLMCFFEKIELKFVKFTLKKVIY